MTEIETVVQPDRVTDDIGRESVAFIRIHRQIISFWRVNLAIPAKEQLEDPAIKLAEVANSIGFRDQGNFNRMFRRLSGMSPNEYRKHCLGAA
jgi:methylphosphotriester-DNA--protein-cysteine methyltransferase